MVVGMAIRNSRRVVTRHSVRTIVRVLVVMVVPLGLSQVPVVEVQPSGFLVMIRRFVDVGDPRHETERQIEGTAAHRKNPTHTEDCIRRPEPTKGGAPAKPGYAALPDRRPSQGETK